jgi:hypothetical protein
MKVNRMNSQLLPAINSFDVASLTVPKDLPSCISYLVRDRGVTGSEVGYPVVYRGITQSLQINTEIVH